MDGLAADPPHHGFLQGMAYWSLPQLGHMRGYVSAIVNQVVRNLRYDIRGVGLLPRYTP